MSSGFWGKLKSPISALAPMAGITDAAHRAIISEIGRPSVIWTEMLSIEGLDHYDVSKYEDVLSFSEDGQPTVLQLFGSDPEKFFKAAELGRERGFSGIDINMGCPDKNVEKQHAGADLINEFELVSEIVEATKRGAREIPVSIKTRVGYTGHNELEKWMSFLAELNPATITIHGRTRNELRNGEANWDSIKKSAGIIRGINKKIIILGNGDIQNAIEGEEKMNYSGVDGYMIGRKSIGNPWAFLKNVEPTLSERLRTALRHTEIFEEKLGKWRKIDQMKIQYVGYFSGFDGAKEIRMKLMGVKSFDEAKGILRGEILKIG